MTQEEGCRAVNRGQQLLVAHREAVLAQPLRDARRRDMAAVREHPELAAARANPLEHLGGAWLRAAATVRSAVHERPVDVEHDAANPVQVESVNHGARAPGRRRR